MSSDVNGKSRDGFDKAFSMLVEEFRLPYDAIQYAVMKDLDAGFDRFCRNITRGNSSDKEEK